MGGGGRDRGEKGKTEREVGVRREIRARGGRHRERGVGWGER